LSAYIDTNVVLARHIPADPHNASSRLFFKETKLRRLVSSLSFLELCCVFSRLLDSGEVQFHPKVEPSLTDLPYPDRVQALVEYALRDCGLVVLDADTIPLTISLLDSPIGTDHIYLEALRLAPQLRLKTLDTLHLAHASCLRDMGVQVEWLVTSDDDMLTRREQISGTLPISVISIDEAVAIGA